jgi:phosphotriesterase-related protein
MNAYLQTVTGPIAVEWVRVADAHSHVWIQPPPGSPPDLIALSDYDDILKELLDFHDAGGTTLIDCQPPGCGRDARMLARLAHATGLHITAVTGFHLRKYYPATNWLWTASTTQAAAAFLEELRAGMNETGGRIPATAIKVGYSGVIDGQEQVLMEAAAEAARQTGAALLFHTEQGQNIEALLPFFSSLGVPPNRLYLCHVDKRPDAGLHRELAQAGVLLGYDTYLRRKYNPDQNLWPLLKAMIVAGMGHKVAFGLDLATPAMWVYGGAEWGLETLPRLIIPRLLQEGIATDVVEGLTGKNVAQHLAWQVS